MMHGENKSCCCPCHKLGAGVLLAALGLTFLLKNLGVYDDSVNNIVWPSLLVLAGLKKIFGGMCKCCNKGSCESKGACEN